MENIKYLILLICFKIGWGELCTLESCRSPSCSCFSTGIPFDVEFKDLPQFVMLTFDDSVNIRNIITYRNLLKGRKNLANDCPIAATFFVCHEYNNYEFTHELYQKGCEIAVHSISHVPDTMMWKEANNTRWSQEIQGMKRIISKFAKIPLEEINGNRAPFLQTNGDTTFEVLQEEEFLYDSSMPTLSHIKPPAWPYTLDYGYSQDCQINPCPAREYPGLWIVPMVNFVKETVVEGHKITTHCSMVDACTPYPETQQDTYDYLKSNFLRHYHSNKAPFPVFLHEAWLQDPERLNGYVEFVDWLLDQDDVYIVTIQEVLNYMKNPVPRSSYTQTKCGPNLPKKECSAKNCVFENVPLGGTRYMSVCDNCPNTYPWIDNPLGQ